MKKITALILVVVLALAMASAAFADGYPDSWNSISRRGGGTYHPPIQHMQ